MRWAPSFFKKKNCLPLVFIFYSFNKQFWFSSYKGPRYTILQRHPAFQAKSSVKGVSVAGGGLPLEKGAVMRKKFSCVFTIDAKIARATEEIPPFT